MERKILLSLLLCLIGMGLAKASDVLTIENVIVPQGSEATIEVRCQFEAEFKGYQFDIELQEGLTLVVDADGKPLCEKGFDGTDHAVSASTISKGKYRFVCVSLTNTLLPMSVPLLRVRVTGAADLAIGTVLNGKVASIELTKKEGNEGINIADIPFTLAIGGTPTPVESVEVAQKAASIVAIYDAPGRKQPRMQHGANIVRMSDGTVRKIMVK